LAALAVLAVALAARAAASAVLAPATRALVVPVRALLVSALHPGSAALLLPEPQVPGLRVLLPQLPRAVARSAAHSVAVVELPSRPSCSAAKARTSASRATVPR
jgi:hypothetical protein